MKLNFTFGRQDGDEDKVRMNIEEKSRKEKMAEEIRKPICVHEDPGD